MIASIFEILLALASPRAANGFAILASKIFRIAAELFRDEPSHNPAIAVLSALRNGPGQFDDQFTILKAQLILLADAGKEKQHSVSVPEIAISEADESDHRFCLWRIYIRDRSRRCQ